MCPHRHFDYSTFHHALTDCPCLWHFYRIYFNSSSPILTNHKIGSRPHKDTLLKFFYWYTFLNIYFIPCMFRPLYSYVWIEYPIQIAFPWSLFPWFYLITLFNFFKFMFLYFVLSLAQHILERILRNKNQWNQPTKYIKYMIKELLKRHRIFISSAKRTLFPQSNDWPSIFLVKKNYMHKI